MPTYLITGASRGLGYAFIRQFANDPANTVIGIVRNKEVTEKKLLEDDIQGILLFEADITDLQDLKTISKELQATLKTGIDYLIANAAFVSNVTATRTLSEFDFDPSILENDLLESFRINVIGQINTINAFLPLIQKGVAKKVIAISSGMADPDLVSSVDLNTHAPYAISKAGLNMVISKYNAQYRKEGVLFIAICPGFVDTALPGAEPPNEFDAGRLKELGVKFLQYAPDFKGPATPAEAARDVMNVAEKASVEGGDGGSFVSHTGTKRWM